MKKKARVKVMAFILVLVTAVVAVPERADAYYPQWLIDSGGITKGYKLPDVITRKKTVFDLYDESTGLWGDAVFIPSKKDYLNRNNHILPGIIGGLDNKGYKKYNKKTLENPKNGLRYSVWPVTKDYKGGIPNKAKYLAELSGKKCWYYPGYADELELFAPDELEKKVIEMLKGRGFKYVPEMLERQYNTGVITKKEYKRSLKEKGDGSWTEISYPANLKSNERPAVGSSWLSDKNRHSVNAYAKDLADAIERHKLGSFKTLEEYKDYKRKLYGEDEDFEGQYAPSFDLNYCGITSMVNGVTRKEVGGKWITKYNCIDVTYLWKIY